MKFSLGIEADSTRLMYSARIGSTVCIFSLTVSVTTVYTSSKASPGGPPTLPSVSASNSCIPISHAHEVLTSSKERHFHALHLLSCMYVAALLCMLDVHRMAVSRQISCIARTMELRGHLGCMQMVRRGKAGTVASHATGNVQVQCVKRGSVCKAREILPSK